MTVIVKLTTTGDRAECTEDAVAFTARTLAEDAATHYGATRLHRRSAIVLRGEGDDEAAQYDGHLTSIARGD